MVARAEGELGAAGVKDAIGTVIADGGYWSQHAVEAVKARGTTVLVPPFSEHNVRRKTATPHGHTAKQMHAELQKPTARAAYRRRQQIVEPIFANTKTLRRADRFMRRGLPACEAEWQLIATTHNLLKLWRRRRPDG